MRAGNWSQVTPCGRSRTPLLVSDSGSSSSTGGLSLLSTVVLVPHTRICGMSTISLPASRSTRRVAVGARATNS